MEKADTLHIFTSAREEMDRRKGNDILDRVVNDAFGYTMESDGGTPRHGHDSEYDYVYSLNLAWIFISASRSEGFDISLLEAMGSGCACLASDIPAHRELIREGVDGYLFKDEAELKKELDLLIESKELRTMLGRYARTKAEGYSWDRTAELTEKVFESAFN